MRENKKKKKKTVELFWMFSFLLRSCNSPPSEHTKQNTKINIQYESEFSQPSPSCGLWEKENVWLERWLLPSWRVGGKRSLPNREFFFLGKDEMMIFLSILFYSTEYYYRILYSTLLYSLLSPISISTVYLLRINGSTTARSPTEPWIHKCLQIILIY